MSDDDQKQQKTTPGGIEISRRVLKNLKSSNIGSRLYVEALEKFGSRFRYDRIHLDSLGCPFHGFVKCTLQEHLNVGCPRCQNIRDEGKNDEYIERLFTQNRFGVLTD